MSLTTIKKINVILTVWLVAVAVMLFIYAIQYNIAGLYVGGVITIIALLGMNIFVFASSVINSGEIETKQRKKLEKNL